MRKLKIASFIAIGLFVLNLVLIWFLISSKPHKNRREGPKKLIIEKLHLEGSQIKQYEKLIEWHRKRIRESETQLMALKNQLYGSLQTKSPPVLKDSLIAEIAKVQMEIEKINYTHFQEIKQLCEPEQLKLFDSLCEEIAQLFSHKPPHPNEKQ